MEKIKTQPPFWLEVKEDYIVDNLDRLIEYLKNYNYDSASEPADSDYNKSFACLHNVAHRIIDKLRCAELTAAVEFDVDYEQALRIISAALLAGLKRGISDNILLAGLVHSLLLCGDFQSVDSRKHLMPLLMKCMSGSQIDKLGIRWADLIEKRAPKTIALLLLRTTWKKSAALHSYLENRGLAMFDGERLIVSPLNYYKFSRANHVDELSLPVGVNYRVASADKSKGRLTTKTIISRLSGYLRDLSAMKPSPVVRKKDYEPGDEAIVRVTNIQGIKLEVETVDSKYNKLTGNLVVQPMGNISRNEFLEALRPGDTLAVEVTPKNKKEQFVLNPDTFEAFYVDTDCFVNEELDAIYFGDYAVGTQWLTETGHIVNIYGNFLSDEEARDLNAAKEHGDVIVVKFKEAKPDRSNHMVFNAEYCHNREPKAYKTEDMFVADAYHTLVRDYCEWSSNDVSSGADNEAKENLDSYYVTVARQLLVTLANDADKTIDRVKLLTMAAIMSYLQEAETDLIYIRHKLEYIGAIVAFAAGEDVKDIELKHSSTEIEDLDEVKHDNAIIEALRGYETDSNIVGGRADEDVVSCVSQLVEASNILFGKINSGEIARIKMAILDYLEVSDEFVHVADDTTNYGIESETVEFKSSIVFPPRNKQTCLGEADPEQQKWAVLNAVCGFLNSTYGGELLLGVKDNGYSCGIKEDVAQLYMLGKILYPTADALRVYVQMLIGKAFKTVDGKDVGFDAVGLHVKVEIEQNKEEHEILRIKVTPNDQIVEYREANRPDWVAKSYVRISGATVPMTDSLRKQIESLRQRR